MASDFGPVKTAQTGHDIRQQQAGQQVAADHTQQAPEQGHGAQFDAQDRDQHSRTDTTGTQVTQQAAALFQCQANGSVYDKQAHSERQNAQGAQVQVKAFCQPLQIVFFARLADDQLTVQRWRQLRVARREVLVQQQAGQFIGLAEQCLSKADVSE